jgi:hypothetical protein
MKRWIVLSFTLLLWLEPQSWAKKPQPPAISACYDRICIVNLRWRLPNILRDQPFQTIDGVLINQSDATMSLVHLGFALKSGLNLAGTAYGIYSGEIPPGGRWYFQAQILEPDSGIFLSRSDSVELDCWLQHGDDGHRIQQTLHFDPLFSPGNRSEQKLWESIYGKRQR